MMSVPIEFLREALSYDPVTGILNWTGGYQEARRAGFVGKGGYRYVQIKQMRFLEHRVVWALHYGEWPELPLDHINMSRSDNRIANLRLATLAENNRNRAKQSNNSTGFKGVTYHRASGRFHARVMVNKVRHMLGSFTTAEAAYEAYLQGAAKLHGEFHHG